jgi:hypothetical protein
MNWLRLYTDITRDHKLRRYDPAVRWVWITLLVMARQSPVPGHLLLSENNPATIDDIRDEAAVSKKIMENSLKIFLEIEKIIEEKDGVFIIKNWDKRQFETVKSTDRVRAYREREKTKKHILKQDETVSKRLSDTETDPETELKDPPPHTNVSYEEEKPAEEAAKKIDPPAEYKPNPNFKLVHDYWINNVHNTNSLVNIMIHEYLDKGMPPDVIILAISEGIKTTPSGVPRINLVETILESWVRAEVKTVKDAELQIANRKIQQQDGKGYQNRASPNPPTREELIRRFYPQLVEKCGEIDFTNYLGGPDCICKGKGIIYVDSSGQANPNSALFEQWPLDEVQRYCHLQKCPHLIINDVIYKKTG